MIEVLIAVLVVALGVLGIIRMQAGMVRTNQSALLRSQASLLVYDLADRMRADRQAALAGAYDRAFTDDIPSGGALPDNELAEWLTRVADRLPGGEGAVTRNGGRVSVAVRWDDSRGEEAPQLFATSTQL